MFLMRLGVAKTSPEVPRKSDFEDSCMFLMYLGVAKTSPVIPGTGDFEDSYMFLMCLEVAKTSSGVPGKAEFEDSSVFLMFFWFVLVRSRSLLFVSCSFLAILGRTCLRDIN